MELTEEQLKKVFNLEIGEVENSWANGVKQEDRFEFSYSIKCPCGKSSLYYNNDIWLGKSNEIKKENIEDACSRASYKILRHIENQIRMNADKYHIDLLINLIGKEKAMELLEKWAKKNLIVALALKKYIEQLKEKEINNETIKQKENRIN